MKALQHDQRKPVYFVIYDFSNQEKVKKVEQLCRRLERDGNIELWRAHKSLEPGQLWINEIERVLPQSDGVLVCLSDEFANPGFKNKELELSLQLAKQKPVGSVFIIPLRMEPCPVPDSLMAFTHLDLFRRGAYCRLLRGLRQQGRRPVERRRWHRRRTDRIRVGRSWTMATKDGKGYVIEDPISPRLYHCLVQRGARITHLSQEESREAAFAQCDRILDQETGQELEARPGPATKKAA